MGNNAESIFPSKSDLKYCKMMFQAQKDIMKRVGFIDDVRSRTNFIFVVWLISC